ncbi:putative fluoride ion transporter CrcB 2 [Streptomyces camponoticapitis]|uniref:Fluoride-specific ion channel FluC n=1 Tax=Streptomyces camponoticapitis TaxID=1616125 RepID=A0ABQ2ETU6_9ACTN|nr:CrcB family protein [Streptomyces camponoticapitis]GGK20358.1 putative fluoride ion transporter CrcB 2 [Streptomyces camponoticapitis]
MNGLWVALGAALGAPMRYLIDKQVQAAWKTVFPWGTLAVNILASLVLGVVTGLVLAGSPDALFSGLGVGLCGALSTYSTFSYTALRLFEDGFRFYAAVNVAVSIMAALGAASLGLALAAYSTA